MNERLEVAFALEQKTRELEEALDKQRELIGETLQLCLDYIELVEE